MGTADLRDCHFAQKMTQIRLSLLSFVNITLVSKSLHFSPPMADDGNPQISRAFNKRLTDSTKMAAHTAPEPIPLSVPIFRIAFRRWMLETRFSPCLGEGWAER
jgi:hypothetical protein